MNHQIYSFLSLFILLYGASASNSASSEEIVDDLDIKIGQMLLIGFRGLEPTDDDPIVRDIRERHIGGVILFDYDVATQSPLRNIQSPEQVSALTASLQKLASIPLLIAIDQEGGRVNRLKEAFGFPLTVSAQYLGTVNDLNTTRKYAEITAATLADLGINLNFAPVVDLNFNPDNPAIGRQQRSFSADPNIVTRHALEFIEAHRHQGVFSTLKHFPGQGTASSDSHRGFVDVTHTWSDMELVPYSNIIKAGQCDAVMTAHIFNAKQDPSLPATLSSRIITGILRDKLQYDGIVVSDDMQMKAISSYYSLETAIQLAIEAGVDILVFANNMVYQEDIAGQAAAIIKNLVLSGKISKDRIHQSYQRILQLKKRLFLTRRPDL